MREQLIHVLTEAAEIEHNLLCSYLYAAFSLRRGVDEGLTPAEAAAVSHWRKSVMSVALEEMAHLALVNNLLVCVGGAPHFNRANFPVPPARRSPTARSSSARTLRASRRRRGSRRLPRRLLELSEIHSGIVGSAANNPLAAAVEQLNRANGG